ncbi:MAG: DUF3370 domain-containing protein [Cyanobacteria bacterium J06638_22]
MFSLLTSLMLAQTPAPQEYVRPQEVRSLPGSLDAVPVFNSNSPEKIGGEGILLSTFPPEGMTDPNAHLNFGFAGRFDVFAHHVYGAVDPEDLTSMYVGILVHNPGDEPIEIDVIEGASYLSQPDAPFTSLPSLVNTSDEEVFAGPGSRAMGDVLRGRQRTALSPTVTIAPGEDMMLLNAPIPVSELEPPLNGRSTMLRLRSDDTVYVASLAMYAQRDTDGLERAPTVEEWRSLLESGSLSEPRDLAPTPLDATGDFRYGRVSGVAIGSRWQTTIADTDDLQFLNIPAPEDAISYPISSLVRGQMGTEQVQTAAMVVRYPDTAYQAHGNYGIEYDLLLPLYNPTDTTQQVVVRLETPIKEDTLSQEGLRFFDPLPTQTFFRGAVELQYRDDTGRRRTHYFHLVQQRGQEGDDLVQLAIAPQNRRPVRVRLLYPPDATPPQVLTIYTLGQ